MQNNLKKANKVLLIIPIIIMIIILVFSVWLFDKDREQTYNRVRNLKESQVQMLASEIDHVITYSEGELTMEEIDMVSTVVTELNKMEGVYCYLYDRDCKLLSEHNGTEIDNKISGSIKSQLENGNYTVLESIDSRGWVEVHEPITDENITIYWQGIPTYPDRTECDFFIILAVSENSVEGNESIDTFKVLVSILTIALTFSLYGNINDYYDDKEKKE